MYFSLTGYRNVGYLNFMTIFPSIVSTFSTLMLDFLVNDCLSNKLITSFGLFPCSNCECMSLSAYTYICLRVCVCMCECCVWCVPHD